MPAIQRESDVLRWPHKCPWANLCHLKFLFFYVNNSTVCRRNRNFYVGDFFQNQGHWEVWHALPNTKIFFSSSVFRVLDQYSAIHVTTKNSIDWLLVEMICPRQSDTFYGHGTFSSISIADTRSAKGNTTEKLFECDTVKRNVVSNKKNWYKYRTYRSKNKMSRDLVSKT